MIRKYNVLIVGAGKIGAFFDSPKTKEVLTHAHAFYKHKSFNLIGFYDTNYNQAKKAAFVWKAKAYDSLEKAFLENSVDVVCVAVPDKYHFKVLMSIAQHLPKIVFSEKPLTNSLGDGKKIVSLYSKRKIPLLINYTRRFVPEFVRIKNEIKQEKYGKFVTGIGYYGKGLIHNGSHLVDLIQYLLGDIEKTHFIKKKADYYKNDSSVSSILTVKGRKLFLQYIECSYYTLFELDLFFENSRIRITNSGKTIEIYNVKNNLQFKGYKNLCLKKTINTSLNHGMYFAAKSIKAFLDNNSQLVCSANDALFILETCFNIKNKK